MTLSPTNPSPLAGEGGARVLSEAKGVGGCGVASRQAAQKTLAEVQSRRKWLIQRARYMRANPTEAERRIWNVLRDRRLGELRWRRQEIIDDLYIVDFICFEHRLIIEGDGSQHSESEKDAERDIYLQSQNFKVLRFWNGDILTNIEGVAETILHAVGILSAQTCADPTPNPLPQGEGALERSPNV
jgi:very-short-patch-repair endonuclease